VIAINVLNRRLQNFDDDEISTLKRLLTKLINEADAIALADAAQNDNDEEDKQ